ncbi:hypothetical protein NC652_022782 [Populus alba x Populus x berolinensis]|nr:hypothetical protein NC652_022782 [Populus alba x Populus x berolinensis]
MLLLRLFQHMKPRYYSSPVLTSLSLFNHSSSCILVHDPLFSYFPAGTGNRLLPPYCWFPFGLVLEWILFWHVEPYSSLCTEQKSVAEHSLEWHMNGGA